MNGFAPLTSPEWYIAKRKYRLRISDNCVIVCFFQEFHLRIFFGRRVLFLTFTNKREGGKILLCEPATAILESSGALLSDAAGYHRADTLPPADNE